jgi:hypothetical protein
MLVSNFLEGISRVKAMILKKIKTTHNSMNGP